MYWIFFGIDDLPMPNWAIISTRACAADYLILRDSQKWVDLIFMGRIFFRFLLVPDFSTTLKKHNLSFPFLYLKVRVLFILWWWRVEGRGWDGMGKILFRFVYVLDICVRPQKHYFSFYFYKIWIGARGRGKVIYFFSDYRVQSNFLQEGAGISLESRVQGPGYSQAFRKWLKNEGKADRTAKVYNLFAKYFD